MPRWRPMAAIALRYFYLMRGSPARVVPLFAWVAIDILLWGFISRYLNNVAHSGFNFVPSLLGAVLLWDFLTRVMQGVTMAFFEDVWSRNFLNIFATPLQISEYLGGLVLTSVATSAVGLAVMLMVAMGAFGFSYLSYGVALAQFVLTIFLFGIALGIFAAGLVLRFGPAAEWFIWPIPALLSPFVGVYYPVATLPLGMRYVSRLLPPSYVFEGVRATVAGHPASVAGSQLAWAAAMSAVYLLCACWTFARIYRHAVRTGLIARYSAESLN